MKLLRKFNGMRFLKNLLSMGTRHPNLDDYVKWGYKSVDGWLEKKAIDLTLYLSRIQRSLGIHGSIGEIGVHHGKYFILLSLMRNLKIETLVAIDLFDELQEENVDHSGRGDERMFKANLKRWGIHLDEVLIIKENTLRLKHSIFNGMGKFRFFSIDGGHTKETVYNDLMLVSPCLVHGGIVVIDDYFNEAWPGVSEGVNLFFNKHPDKLYPFLIGGNKIFFTNDFYWSLIYKNQFQHVNNNYKIKINYLFSSSVYVVRSNLNNQSYKRILYRILLRLYHSIRKIFTYLTQNSTTTSLDSSISDPFLKILPYLLNVDYVYVDVGANKGKYIHAALRKVSEKNIYAFEPIATTYIDLKRKFPQANIYNIALSNKRGNFKIKTPVVDGVVHYTRSTLNLGFKENQETDHLTNEVVVDTLDSFLGEIRKIDFIKIDIEGHELYFIQGAINLIKKYKPDLLIEIEARHGLETSNQTILLLNELGYQLYYFSIENKTLVPFDGMLSDIQRSGRPNEIGYINNFYCTTKPNFFVDAINRLVQLNF